MWDHMQDPIAGRAAPQPGGLADHVEIYLPEQVMVIFHADVPALVTHMSCGQQNPDGTPFEYSDDVTIDTDEVGNPLPEPVTKPIRGLAKTPRGCLRAPAARSRGAQRPARRDVEPGLLQLRHRHPRRPQRAARAGVPRLHPRLRAISSTIVQDLIDKGDSV